MTTEKLPYKITPTSTEDVRNGMVTLASTVMGPLTIEAQALCDGDRIRVFIHGEGEQCATVMLTRAAAVALCHALRSELAATAPEPSLIPQSATCGTCLHEEIPPAGGTWVGDLYTCAACREAREEAPRG